MEGFYYRRSQRAWCSTVCSWSYTRRCNSIIKAY
jgi:hypothetical protein